MGEKRIFTPEEITSMILSEIKESAQIYLGEEITEAVIAVPTYFNDFQRQATKEAAILTGLNVLRIINEPTAAALAYGLDEYPNSENNILIFDLGGSTFNVTILGIEDGIFEVKSSVSDMHLGGEVFDNRLVEYFADEFHQKFGNNLLSDQKALLKLKAACENVKKNLSSKTEARIKVEALCEGNDFCATITRDCFDKLCEDVFEKLQHPMERALLDAKLEKSQINEVIMTGGSSYIPRVQKLVQNFCDGKELLKSINPDEVVAAGAAKIASILSTQVEENIGGLVACSCWFVPLSLGIETAGGVMTTLVKRNSSYPLRKTQRFTTVADMQSTVMIQVFQGERAFTRDNIFRGKLPITGIPPAPEGIPQIEVTFEIDANEILYVSARNISTEKSDKIMITDEKRLSLEELDRIIENAETFKNEDENELNRITIEMSILQSKSSNECYEEDEENFVHCSNSTAVVVCAKNEERVKLSIEEID